MEFYETDDGRLGMREIPAVVTELLRQIPRWADGETDEVEDRLFPSPATGAAEAELRADWQAHVEPELHEFFQSTRQVVEADLRGMAEEDDGFILEFSLKHADAWLNALNQARLALATRHRFEEEDLAGRGPREVRDERELALFQIHFYAMIQHWLLEILDSREFGEDEP
jgi:hypothetical protein